MRVLIRAVYDKRADLLKDLAGLARREIERVLDDEVKPVLLKSHEVVVAGWEHRVIFAARKHIESNRISLTVFPTSNQDIWNFVDQGTDPHSIDVVSAPYLVFPRGPYEPKTLARPARTVSGGGYAKDKSLVKVKHVDHPGSEPREFTKAIAEDIKPSYQAEMENAFRRVARAVQG